MLRSTRWTVPTARRRHATSAVAALALALSACASGSGASTDDASAIDVVVDNNLVPSTQVTVWAIPETGTQIRLGNVAPGQQGTLRYTPRTNALSYRLRAQTTAGRDIFSNPINLVGANQVSWNLQTNIAIVADAPAE